jgi:hypothetical protein
VSSNKPTSHSETLPRTAAFVYKDSIGGAT